MRKKWSTITLLKASRVLEKMGMPKNLKAEVLKSLFPKKGNKKLKISRKIIQRILVNLQNNGKCGLQLTKRGRIYVVSAKHCAFSNFNFQRPEVLQKALKIRGKGVDHGQTV